MALAERGHGVRDVLEGVRVDDETERAVRVREVLDVDVGVVGGDVPRESAKEPSDHVATR